MQEGLFSFTKQKIKIASIILGLAFVLFLAYYLLFGCLSFWNSAPLYCDSLSSPVPFIKILSVFFELPYFLFSQFVSINDIGNYTGLALVIGFLLELIYVYLLACLYVNRKEIAKNNSKLKIFLLILVFLYFSWIVLYDIPKNLDMDYSYDNDATCGFNTIEDSTTGLIEKSYNSVISNIPKGYFSLIWPWTIYKGNVGQPWCRSNIESLSIAFGSVILLFMATFLIQYVFFRREKIY